MLLKDNFVRLNSTVYVLYLPQLHFNATQGKILQYFIKAEKEVFPTTPPGDPFNKLALIY
jgi:hypothetical protein